MHLATILLAGMLAAPPATQGGLTSAAGDPPLPIVARTLEQSAQAVERDKKGKKKKRKKASKKSDKKKVTKVKLPEWEYGDGPFSHFLWLARQFPDFEGFRSSADEIAVSIVAHRKKALLFLDSCTANQKKSGWRISNCNAVKLKDKDFLGRLVKAGTDTSANPDSLKSLGKFMKEIRRTAKRKDLLPLLMEASVANREGYRLLDDVEADEKACGARSYYRALGTLPKPAYLGPNVVVIDLAYKVQRKGSYKVHASFAKTDKGWRLGGLRVHCY